MTTNRENLRLLAEGMYVNDGLTGKAIAEWVGVTEKTISKWKIKGNWDNKKNTQNLAPHKIKALLFKHTEYLLEGKDTKDDRGDLPEINADKILKIVKAINEVDDQVNARVTFLLLKELSTDISMHEPELAIKLIPHFKRFLNNKLDNGDK